MDWKLGTLVVLGVSSGAILIWDIIVATNKVPNSEDTVSGIIKGWFVKKGVWPLAWIWGGLGVHFFVPGSPELTGSTWWGVSTLPVTFSILLGLGMKYGPGLSQKWWRVGLRGLALLVLGGVQAWFFFPQ